MITETEKNQQAGLMHMCMGLMYHVRNPLPMKHSDINI